MNTFIFKRESDDFKDILTDVSLAKIIRQKTVWTNHLMITLSLLAPESIVSYIRLKYGDDLVPASKTDFTPIPGKDYIIDHQVYSPLVVSD